MYFSLVVIFLSTFTMGGVLPAGAQTQKSGQDAMTETLQPLTGKKFEADFLNQMIQHHRSAIQMAKIVPTHTKRPELKGLANNIISMQGKEIDELTHWLKEWQGTEPKMMPNKMAEDKMHAEMPMLETAKDSEFDKMFLKMMIEHHAGAVRMSTLVKEKSTRPELLQFATKVIRDQTSEIKQMKAWEKAWFKS